MRVVTVQSVIDLAAIKYQGQSSRIDAKLGASLLQFINEAGRARWESVFHPDWTTVEERAFRADWLVGTAYAAPAATVPVEVLHRRSLAYLQTLRASTGQEPANATDQVNYAYWHPCLASYAGDDWAASTAYTGGTATDTPGSVVRNPADGRYYACHTTHTSGATFDSTKFGILTPFLRDIDYEQAGKTAIGAVRDVWDADPRILPGAAPLKFDIADTGVIVPGGGRGGSYYGGINLQPATVWLEYRSRWTDHVAGGSSFPYVLSLWAANAAAAEQFRAEGQDDKFTAKMKDAAAHWARELDILERQQRQTRPLRVAVRN